MAKTGLLDVIMWIVGVLVSLAVGFGMTSGTLTVPYVQPIVPIAGWIVVLGTVIGVIMAIVKAIK
ncbi:MAG TPA: hypothetical protein VMZ91_07775 [Candidatus Paceibacterota bacterium]|nr:hypothetical protein [Candidatus Paceibacterota bacterium]